MSLLCQAVLFSVQPWPNGTLVKVHPHELDETNALGFDDDLFDLAKQGPGLTLYLDLGNVQFMTSYVWLRLVRLHRRLKVSTRRLCLLNLSPAVRTLLNDVHLAGLLIIREGPPSEVAP